MKTGAAISRREFLRTACTAVGTAALANTVFDLSRMAAASSLYRFNPGDYKALVCVFLYGGNDGNNTIVPTGTLDYGDYAAARGALALPRASLLPIAPLHSDGRSWGLHPSLSGIRNLFAQRHAAILANVGPLVAPVTRDDYLMGSAALPPQLFSHSDQTVHWMTALPDRPALSGWGGRTADLLRNLNANAQISMSISVAGTNTFQVGNQVTQYQVSTEGAMGLDYYQTGPFADPSSRAIKSLIETPYSNLLERAYAGIKKRAIDNGEMLGAALDATPPLATEFPDTDLGRQLRMVARLIGARSPLEQQRQIFFVATGGYDTHGDQLAPQASLLAELDQSLSAFYQATVEMGVAPQVTSFTASDFGRTYTANVDGSDHGWGGHHFILGGAVQGGDIYGAMPTLAIEGPDDTEQGRWIPTTSVDEYSATLAKWFGVAPGNLTDVFPNLGRFARPDLGFLG